MTRQHIPTADEVSTSDEALAAARAHRRAAAGVARAEAAQRGDLPAAPGRQLVDPNTALMLRGQAPQTASARRTWSIHHGSADALVERANQLKAKEAKAMTTTQNDHRVEELEARVADLLEQQEIRANAVNAQGRMDQPTRSASMGRELGTGVRFADITQNRYGTWLGQYSKRANTVDTTTMSGAGASPIGNDVQASWFDLIRPQSRLLDAFPWVVVQTDRTQVDLPHIKADSPASATNEGADITGNSGLDVESITASPAKYTSYEAVSTEVWRDAQPSILDAFATGIVKRHSLAWEAALVAALEAGATTVATDANFATNLDVISDAIVTMQAAGGTPSGIVTTAAVAQTLLKVKEIAGSTKPILSGPADGFAGYVLGVPLIVSAAVTATKACLFDASHTVLVVRQTPLVEVSNDALFDTDSVAVRAVSRFAAKVMNATGGAYLLTDAA